jgi:hypothetical protein
MSGQAWTITKDVALFVAGLGGIVYQLLTGEVDIALLTVFTAMTGVPGLTNLVSLLRNGSGITSPPSTSQPAQSEPDSPR